MSSGIYAYIDKKTKEIVYIGKDSYIHKKARHYQHIAPSSYNNQQINKVLQRNPKRYKYKILEKGNIPGKILNALEMSFIQKYKPIFNFTQGGEGNIGYKHSDEAKEKMKKRDCFGEKNGFYGKKHNDETLIKMSKKKNNSGFFRVTTHKRKNGFIFEYRYYDSNKKRISISSKSLDVLEEKVKEKGLIWKKITN